MMRVVHPVTRSGSGLQPKLAEFLQTCSEEIPSRDDDDDDDDEAEYADDGEDETEDDPCWSTLVGGREIGNASRTRTRTRIRTHTPLTHHPPTFPPTHQTCMSEILTSINTGASDFATTARRRTGGKAQCMTRRPPPCNAAGHSRRCAWSDCCMCAVRSMG